MQKEKIDLNRVKQDCLNYLFMEDDGNVHILECYS